MDCFIQEIRFSLLETYFDGISNVHCCELTTWDQEQQYIMQEIIVDIIYDCSNFKVLIVKLLDLEYFDLPGKIIINDNILFEISTIIGTKTLANFKRCGNIFS